MTKEELSKKVDDFVKKYAGQTKGYPNDSSYQGECLSIVKLYIKEVFGIDAPPSGSNSAYGYWTNFPSPLPTIFDKVQNTLTNIPEKGDVPIWTTAVGGGFGHIALFVSGDVNAFTSFDQNFGGRQAHLQSHDYTNVVGWLKAKTSSMVLAPDVITNPQTKLDLGSPWGVKELQATVSTLNDQKKTIDSFNDRLKNAVDSAISEKEVVWQTKLDTANTEIERLKTLVAEDMSYSDLFSIAFKKLWIFRKGK